MTDVRFSFVDVDGSPRSESVLVTDGDGDAGKPLIVLVHGLGGDVRDFTDPATHPGRPHLDYAAPYPPPQDAGWHWLPGLTFIGAFELDPPKVVRSWQQVLTERGFRSVTYAQLDNNGFAARPLLQLEGLVRALTTTFPNAKLAFVAHSRGGILVRKLLKDHAGDPALQGRVAAVVTLHTPHQGTDLATIAVVLNAAIAELSSRTNGIVDPLLAPIVAEVNSNAYQELATNSRFLADLAGGETAFPGARYYTFGGTSVRYSRVNWWTTTLESSISQWTLPPYHWTIFESELPFNSPLLDILPDLTPEITQGAGDGLVADGRSRLPYAVHESLPLNHAEPLWDTALQERVLSLLDPGRSRFLSLTLQRDWRWCSKCQSLFFGGGQTSSSCPAGGAHAPPAESGSGNYGLPHNVPPDPELQAPWHWCNKCQSLFFGGGQTSSSCPAGGAHAPPAESGSGNYSLPHNAAVSAELQCDWRWCSKCQSLFFGGGQANSLCPAGGAHAPPAESGSGNYCLPHQSA